MDIIKHEIHDVRDILLLRKDWEKLEKGRDMTTFQTFEWHRLLIQEWYGWKLHALYSRVRVYIAYENDQPVMIFPAIIYRFSTRTKWFGQYRGIYLLGQGSYSDYMNVIYDSFSDQAFQTIVLEIQKDFPAFPILLTSMRGDWESASGMTRIGIEKQESDVAVAVHRKESAEVYTGSLSKNTKQNLRTAMNRINRDGLRYELTVTGRLTDRQVLDTLQAIHIKRMKIKNQNHEDIVHAVSSWIRRSVRSYREKHHNIVMMSMQENENSCLIMIRLNDEIAGYLYGLREEQAIRIIHNCFDERFKFYSPLFRGAYDFILSIYEKDADVREIDFTRGDEAYKYKLGGEEIKLYDFRIPARSGS